MAVVCMSCGRDVAEVPGCALGTYMDGTGRFYQAIPSSEGGLACPDCGAVRGEPHHIHCSVELCPKCAGQLLGCACRLTWLRLA